MLIVKLEVVLRLLGLRTPETLKTIGPLSFVRSSRGTAFLTTICVAFIWQEGVACTLVLKSEHCGCCYSEISVLGRPITKNPSLNRGLLTYT